MGRPPKDPDQISSPKQPKVMFRSKFSNLRVIIKPGRFARYSDGTRYLETEPIYADFVNGVYITDSPDHIEKIRKTHHFARNEVFEILLKEQMASGVNPLDLGVRCEICSNHIAADRLLQHRQTCLGTNYICDGCGGSYPSARGLEAHRTGCEAYSNSTPALMNEVAAQQVEV